MRYFSYITHTYSINNNLERAILQLLKGYNRKIITSVELPEFKKMIIGCIDQLNQAHPRCKPFKVSWGNSEKVDTHLSGIYGICHFYLYEEQI
ncbi:MAG: hypothetical protein WBP45_12585 [Daejeonella sp.]